MPTIAILAGGLATRLGPLTESKPKSMLPVAGEPFIAHQLRLLAQQGLPDVVICAGHLAAQIQDFVGDGSAFGARVGYSLDGNTPPGTGGALRRALPLLGDSFLVLYGDSYLREPFSPVWESFQRSGRSALMTVFRNQGEWDTSNVSFAGGEIVRYEKAAARGADSSLDSIDYGLGCIRSTALAKWPPDKSFDLAEFYQAMLAQKQLAAYEVKERFYEIGSPAGLAETEALLSRPAAGRGE